MNRKSIGGVLLEVFSIVLGVLLALGVSEWQEERKKDELADKALVNIHNELAANRTILESIHANNQESIKLAQAASDEDDDSTEDRQFIPGIQVRSTAWETLQSSGVANYLDFELLLALSEAYSMQAIYTQTGTQLVEASMTMSAMAAANNSELDNQAFQQQFMGYFSMMLAMEETLLQGYTETLQQLAPAPNQ
ncbi:MAG: hypothetical protein ABJ308_02905 [Halieaceae bacterium]